MKRNVTDMVRQDILKKETGLINTRRQFNEATNVCSQTEEYMFTGMPLGDGLESVTCGLGVLPLRTGSSSPADYCGTTGFLRRMTMLLLLMVMSSVLNTAWAYNYTYKVIDESGNLVATATTSSSTLALPAEIKAVSCRVRYYCSDNEATDQTDAQNMNLTSEITSLPANDATIYVGYRYSMRIFPSPDNGQYGYIVQNNNEGDDVSDGLGYDASTSSFVLMSIGKNTDNDNYRWQFGGNPYKATLKWKGDTDKYLHYDGSKFELSTTPSYFMILYNSHGSNNYAFRLNDEVNTTISYLDRDGSKTPRIYTGTYGSTFGLHKGANYEPWYDVYDSYGNLVVNRHNNGGWNQNTYTTKTVESNMGNPLGNEQSRWVKDLKVYATNPGTDPNAVVLERTPCAPDRIEYMQFSPRLKDDNVPGILQALGSEDVLDLTGQTKYQIRINGTNYIYAKNETTAGYTSNELELRGDAYLWRLKGGDPYHIILENAGNGKVLTYSITPTYDTETKSSSIVRKTSASGSNVLTLSTLGESPHTHQCFGLMTKGLDRTTGTYAFDYLVAQGYSNNWPAIQTYNNQVILKTDFAPWGKDDDSNVKIVKVEFIEYVYRADVHYVIIDNNGNEAVEYTALSETLLIPASIKSPLAADYRFYNTKAKAVSDLEADRITDIDDAEDLGNDEKRVYVRYTLSPTQTLLGTNSYSQMTFVAQSSRILGISNVSGRDRQVYGSDDDYWKYYQDSWLWRIDGTDPYNFTIRNFSDESYICKTSNTSGQPVTVTSTAEDGAHFIMLFNDYQNETGMSLLMRPKTNEDNYMLMEGNSAPPVFTDRSAADMATLLVTARESDYYNVSFSGVTYIVVSHDGSIATMSTTSDAAGATPSLPAIINSPLATNFRYYTSLADAQNDDGTTAYIAAHAITSLPSNHCSVFVRYDNNLDGTDFDLSGDLSHHIIHYNTGKYAVVPASPSNNHFSSSNILQDKTEEQAKADLYCSWSIFGNDPYNAKIYSVAEPTRNLRIEDPAKNSNRNIAICGTSESTFYSAGNYCPLDRFIILGGGYTDTYYLMEATNRRTDTRYYAKKNNEEIKFEPKDYYVDYSKDWFKNERSFRFVSPFKRDVTFHIIDRNGREAISATHEWHTDKTLPTVAVKGGAIPTEIYSPYLESETLTWYGGYDAVAKSVTGDPITRMDNSASDVYVTYTTDHLSEKPLHFAGARGFEMKVNGEYVYDDNGTLQSTDFETDKDEKEHLWNTIGNDPYAIQIRNVGTPTRFFNWSISPTQSITLGSGSGDNTYFIAMKRTDATENMVTELMAATGANLSSSDYYSIGRLAEGSPTMLRSDSYSHEDAAIQIILTPAHFDVTYRVIDKQNKIILEVPATEIDLGLPNAWKSPLVPENGYHYWIRNQFNISDDIYELRSGITTANEAIGISESTDGYIYVTYDVITDDSDPNFIDLNSDVDYSERVSRSAADNTQVRNAAKFGAMYMLQFTTSADYYLEDGGDDVETTATTTGTHVYPYTNGDGPMYIYTESRWNSQKDGGASTRTRWPWYLLSPNNDPYHVMVTSWQNSHPNNGTNYYSFLRTFYNETLGSVVTNNVTDDPRTLDGDNNQILPTEYMLLNGNGTTGKYMLRTTEKINGTHEPVTSFEQYWRNNPTALYKNARAIKGSALTDSEKTALKTGQSALATDNANLTTNGWHNYEHYVYAAPWAGGSKSYSEDNHWFMTVNVGDGSFNIVPTEIDAVLVLLDNHGWEIMRQNIAKHSEPAKYAAAQAALRKYDSPMVSQYKFYGVKGVDHKVSGYHKYNIENGSNKALKDANRLEKTTTFTSLADYPEKYDGGALLDLYVTYDVKPQYAEAYTGAATKAETSVKKAFIIRQDGKLAKTTDGTTLSTIDASKTGIDAGTTDGLDDEDLYWYLKPNFDIDTEMGYLYDVDVNGKKEGASINQEQTDANYTTYHQDGFDPYNIQIVNKEHGGYFTTNANGASVVNHRYLEGTYPSTPGTLSLVGEPSAQFNPVITDYDSKELHITNATFMAVQDANGNMRLMPRFDHSRVITDFATIEEQHDAQPEDDKVDGQSTILMQYKVYTYVIVDKQGNQALQYMSFGDLEPKIEEKFRSPLATNFKFYATATPDNETPEVSNLSSASLTDDKVYVFYDYDPTADTDGLLKGTWYHTKLNGSDVQVTSSNIASGTGSEYWRFMQNVGSTPDPYAVTLWNNTPATYDNHRFIVMKHDDGAYALMEASGNSTYSFLNGSSLPATIAQAEDYGKTGTIPSATKLTLTPTAIVTNVIYKIITHTGKVALTSASIPVTAETTLSLPLWMQTPIMDTKGYEFYSAADYNSETGTYTVKGYASEKPTALESDGTVYVRYDYEKWKKGTTYNKLHSSRVPVETRTWATTAKLDLEGNIPYYLVQTQGQWYWFNFNREETGVTQDLAQKNNVDNIPQGGTSADMMWYLTGNDPYEIQICNYTIGRDKFLSVKDLSGDAASSTRDTAQPSKILAEGADANYPFNTFMLLKASNADYLTLFVTGHENLSLQEYGTTIKVSKDVTPYHERYGSSQINTIATNVETFAFCPAVLFHVITNNGVEAIAGCSSYKNTAMQMPTKIQTPLVNDEDYTFYSEKPIWNNETKELTVNSAKELTEGTSLQALHDNGIYDIYVRYKYSKDTTPFEVPAGVDKTETVKLDLTGSTWYTMAMNKKYTGEKVTDNYSGVLYVETSTSDNNTYMVKEGINVEESKTKDPEINLSDKRVLWLLEGNDPYAIKIRNAYKGTDAYLSGDGGTVSFTKDDATVPKYATFMYLKIRSQGENTCTIDNGATFVPTGYLADTRTFNVSSNQVVLFPWNDLSLRLGDEGYKPNSNNNTHTSWVYFYKAPVARKYHYHAIKYDAGGNKVGQTWDAVLEHDFLAPLVLENNIARLYAKYEANTVGNSLEVTGSNDFKTRTALEAANNAQFYSNEGMTERVYDSSSGNYDIYPEIDENQIYDIYFKYQVDNEATDINGKTLSELTSSPAQISSDVTTYTDKGKLDADTKQANWWFMVLDTDYDLTRTVDGSGNKTYTGKQQFLRREDNGNVGWMNNDYALHYLNEDNYNGWSYHRIAEWYRNGDNDAFREGRWLWTFMGDDPYNMQVLNMESVVGVQAKGEGVYELKAANDCWATISKQETKDNNGNVTSTYYPVRIPTDKPEENYNWGLVDGNNSDGTLKLLSTAMTTELDGKTVNLAHYWQMENDSVVGHSVSGTQAIRLLEYVPVIYQDVNLVIKREDHVKDYVDNYRSTLSTINAKRAKLQSYDSGLSLLYFTADERSYCAGDKIDMSKDDALPLNVRRAFCDYTLYSDDYVTTGGTYTVTDGPYPDKSVQATKNGSWTSGGDSADDTYTPSGDPVYDEDGRPVYPYYTIDANGYKRGADGGAQSLYVKYKVTSDIFLKTAPTKTQVQDMAANNDHVYFMDFPGESSNVHHAFFDNEATFRIQTGDLSQKKDANTGKWRTEKKKWDGSTFADNQNEPYNNCQFRTSDDRMTSVPEDLKWYFVGDPYKVRVFNTAGEWKTNNSTETVAANLARFNPVETNFQFVVDCVHMQIPDYENIDNRNLVYPTDSLGRALDPIANRNKGKPYFNDFYWEVVPTVSTDPDAFALRFKEDNDLMGYRNVYYYLAHDGLTKRYRVDGENVTYHVNLNYNPTNSRRESGTYLGYHTANDNNTVIRLVQPVKVYITATKNGTPVVTDELSEYYGLDEMLDDVPRHLKRKFVSYDAMQHKLTAANATSKGTCTVSSPTSPEHPASYVKLDPTTKEVVPTYKNVVFKYNVGYTVNDITSSGVHLFTPAANPASPTTDELSNVQWLDMMVGLDNDNSQKHWAYYDKLNVGGSPAVENQKDCISDYRRAMSSNKVTGWNNDVNGWDDGLKGLHWAFIGDPYDFTILNRRRYEDGNNTEAQWLTVTKATIPDFKATVPNDSVIWTTSMATTTDDRRNSSEISAASTATHFSTQMWKLGGDDDYFLRTASLKPASSADSETNNYWRMVAKTYTASTPYSFFEMVPFSLSDKSRLTDNQNTLNYGNYVTNDYGYSKTMSGLGAMQQRLIIRTAVAKDEDKANNDCFDANVQIVTSTGLRRIYKENMEVKYGEVNAMLPYSLRRYGCTYECYLDYVDINNKGTKIENFDTEDFRSAIATAKETGETPTLTYIYHVEEDVSQYFTTASNALTEDYTWINSYFAWNQKYSGTFVEVEYYEKVFDHYVYNEQGQIIDEVYRTVRKTRVVQNPTEAYPTTAYLNSHTNQSNIYADEGTQSENDRQKWSLIGDPYEFTMKNYAQYLVNQNAILTLQSSNVNNSVVNAEAQNFAIGIDKDGNAYLSVINENGEVITNISFDFNTSSDKHLKTVGSGTNQNDPTGNTYDVSNVKPFVLTNLLSYADLVQYHLVIAHQHSLDHTDALSTDNAATLNNHLLEYLMYQGLQKGTKDLYVNITDNEPTGIKTGQENNVRELLKQNASLRDFISYPIADYGVARVGIGNHPQVPWYMKRQFCRYYLYQKDVQRSATDYDSPALEEADASWTGEKEMINGTFYKIDPSSSYKVDVYIEGGKIYLWTAAAEAAGKTKIQDVVQRTFVEDGETKRAYNIKWQSIFDKSEWDDWTAADEEAMTKGDLDANRKVEVPTGTGVYKKAPKGYAQALDLQGKVLDRLQDCHYNRKVLIDVVYEVTPEDFRFADKGRNTTAWYQMMTNNEDDGLMNFTYKDGIGARLDRTEHYTNNYLWAPEGDPYGFVLRSRYATINGTGWDNVAVTTKGHLPKASDYSSYSGLSEENYLASYTDHTQFDDHRIIHKLTGDDEGAVTTDGPTNAVYEMFTGDAAFTNSFLMHPTSAYLDNTDSDFKSYYMKHFIDKTDPAHPVHTTKLTYTSGRTLQTDTDANWSLRATAEQLYPYFKYAGYVGGIKPEKAVSDFNYQDYYTTLQNAVTNGTAVDFTTLRKIQEVVYAGTFYKKGGIDDSHKLEYTAPRPTGNDLPLTFVSTNLVNMTDGYYRIAGFSTDALNAAEKDNATTGYKGIQGTRYVSGYRFASEVTSSKPLRFFETTKDDATIHTFADLNASTPFTADAPLQGNIELLPADFDASSIFKFTTDNAAYSKYTLSTQGLNVQAATAGDVTMSSSTGTALRLDDIGGAAVTLRYFNGEPADWDANVDDNIKTNYITSNGDSYSISMDVNNELNETNSIQDTKWLLQPVGIHEEWPYNEMPLRVEVQKGGVNSSGNEDTYYYGSLYVPFDTRLGNTTDAAFTLTSNPAAWGTFEAPGTVTMSSVSRLNEMGNPPFVPADWPVVVRTNQAGSITLKNQPVGDAEPTTYSTRHYVNMYIPNVTPTVIANALNGTKEIKLSGEYLEKTLTGVDDKTIMVFGLPFEGLDSHSSHEYDNTKQVGWYTNENWERENAPTKKAHIGSYPNIGEDDLVASDGDGERNNKYVYHNKIYYVYDSPSPAPRFNIVVFDGDELLEDTDNPEDSGDSENSDSSEKTTPWPCDVFDLQGRRVAVNETPETLRRNHPGLPKGVYIFGHKKVIVK